MNTLSYRTISANNKTVKRDWYVVDADGQTLGRIASRIASVIMGKNKTYFTPHVDCGDHVVVINADKIRLTGKKWTQKEYMTFTGYPGGQKIKSATEKFNNKPTSLLEDAVIDMLPKTILGAAMRKKLHVVAGPAHTFTNHQPKPLKF